MASCLPDGSQQDQVWLGNQDMKGELSLPSPCNSKKASKNSGPKGKIQRVVLGWHKALHLGVQYQNKLQRSRHPNSTRIPIRLTTQTNVGWPWPWTTPKAFSPFETYPVFARKRSWYEVITITAKPSKPVPHLRQFPNNQNLQQGIITVCRTLGKSCQPSLPNQVIFPKITWRSLLQVTGSSYLENCSKDAMTWHIWLPQFARQPLQYGDKYKSLKHIFKASSTHTIHVHR